MIYRGEQDLADAVADGKLTAHDADAVRGFATMLTALAGADPRQPRTWTPAQLHAVADYYDESDPELHPAAEKMRARAARLTDLQTTATAARARGDQQAERDALDKLALLERPDA